MHLYAVKSTAAPTVFIKAKSLEEATESVFDKLHINLNDWIEMKGNTVTSRIDTIAELMELIPNEFIAGMVER